MAEHPPLEGARLPLGFAHRGGHLGGHQANTIDAFRSALAAGARGLESDVRLTADAVPVLLHPRLLVRDSLRARNRADLPPRVPSLDDLYERCGAGFELALDMAAPRAASAVVETARRHQAADRLWLTYWAVDVLSGWRRRWDDVRLVFPTLLLPWRRPERLLDRLAGAGVDALNVHHRQLSPRLAEQTHRRGMILLGWGIRRGARRVTRALACGADGVFVDAVTDMVAGIDMSRRRADRA